MAAVMVLMVPAQGGGDKEQADGEYVGKVPVIKGGTGKLKQTIDQPAGHQRDQVMMAVAELTYLLVKMI